jgi:hypothetical protein
MQTRGIVDILNKLADVVLCLLKRLILLQADFLSLQGLEKAFGFGVIIGGAYRWHANLRLNLSQSSHLLGTGILDSPIRRMDQASFELASRDGIVQGG